MSQSPPSYTPMQPPTDLPPGRRKRRVWPWVLGGCLGVVLLVVVVCAVSGFLAVRWGRAKAGNFIHEQLVVMVRDSRLPADQKTQIEHRLDSLHDDFTAGRIGFKDFGNIMVRIQNGPLVPVAMTYGFAERDMKTAILPPQEKIDGWLTCQRFIRGVMEGKITHDEAERVLEPVVSSDPNRKRLRPSVGPQEVRDVLTAMKQICEEKNVQEGDYTPPIADEVDKEIDQALKQP